MVAASARSVGAVRGRTRAPVLLPALALSRRAQIAGGKGDVHEILSELRGADETGKTNRIKLLDAQGKSTSVVVSDALMEDIVRPFYSERVRLRVQGQRTLKVVGLPERVER